MESLLKLNNISKKFKNKTILKNVSLDIKAGDSIVFIGHNGCGKSTLLKIIGGLVTYDSGYMKSERNLKFNYVPEHFPKMAITARQYIKSVGMIEGIDKNSLDSISTDLFKSLHLDTMLDIPIKFLSKGTIQKVVVAQAMLTTPDILLLDEPLSGQDADSQQVFLKMVNKMNLSGTAIIMSCHEDWLIRSISKKVYEIVDHELIKSNKIEKPETEYKILRFGLAKYGDDKIDYDNLNIKDIVLKSDSINGEEIIYVKDEYCNAAIKKMISNGYELRGMKNETIH